MISNEKKLEMMRKSWKGPTNSDDEKLVFQVAEYAMEEFFFRGYLAALRQLGPVILASKRAIEFDHLSRFDIVEELKEALRQAGLEE